jgi:malate dehydrogenase (oxaloacetate-decarboxylating)
LPLAEQRIAIVGFGQAGSGVANAIVTMMHAETGLSVAEARQMIWAIDVEDLLVEGARVERHQQAFVRERAEIADWRIPSGGHGCGLSGARGRIWDTRG